MFFKNTLKSRALWTDLGRKTEVGLLEPEDHEIRVDYGVAFDTEFKESGDACVG